LPELTDEVVQSLEKPSIRTVEELKESLLMAETGRRSERLRDAIQDAIMDELASIVDMSVSETALMETAKVRYQAMLLDLRSKVLLVQLKLLRFFLRGGLGPRPWSRWHQRRC